MTASVAQIAESVVRRDRAGDQNAKALIIECRKAAQKGSAKAQQMIRAIIHYCQTHPLRTGSVGFGAEVAQLGPAFTASASAPLLPPPGTPPGALALPPASVRGLGLLKGLVCLGEGDESGLDDGGRLVCVHHCLVLLPVDQNTSDIAALVLADGAPLTVPRLDALASGAPDAGMMDLFKRYVAGVGPDPKQLPPVVVPVAHAGDIVGKARALQLARRPGGPFEPVIGCEW